MHKLFTKIKNSPKWNSGTNQQVISLSLASKENCEDNKDHHALMPKLNRGGLWFITDDMQSIMLIAEKCFRKETMLLQKHLIEFNLICQDKIPPKMQQYNLNGKSFLVVPSFNIIMLKKTFSQVS